MNTSTAKLETATLSGREYKLFPERREMVGNKKLGVGMAIREGQTVWACGQDGNTYAIALTKEGEPERFVSKQFLESKDED